MSSPDEPKTNAEWIAERKAELHERLNDPVFMAKTLSGRWKDDAPKESWSPKPLDPHAAEIFQNILRRKDGGA